MRILTLLFPFIATVALAQSDPEQDTTRTYDADPVTVTATRVGVTRTNISPSVSVIPEAVLSVQPERSILSVLSQQVPSLFVTERGLLGFGTNTGAGLVTIRGVGGSPNTQVLMLIDGRPQFMGLFGHPLGDSYLTTATERIEVIRGPASVLYGSNAMGGVINIITGEPKYEGWKASGNVRHGSFNTTTASARAGYGGTGWNASVSGTYQRTDGHRPESDYAVRSASARAGAWITDGLTMTAEGAMTIFRTSDPRPVYSPDLDHWVDILRAYAGISLDNSFGPFEGGLRLVHNHGDHAIYDGFRSTDALTAISLYQSARLLPGNILTIGIDYKTYGGNVSAAPPPTKQGDYRLTEYAFSLQVRQSVLEPLTIDGGIRMEHHELYGWEAIPQVGAVFRVTEATTIRATAAKGFRSPAVFQFYLFPPSNTAIGPERSYSYEVGVSRTFSSSANAEVVGYVIESSDLIETIPGAPPRFRNRGNVINRGVELSGALLPGADLELRGSYSYFHAAERIASVPRHKLFLGCSVLLDRVRLDLTTQYIHTIFGRNSANTLIPMDNYLLLGIQARVPVIANSALTLSAENLLNASYQTIYGYPMPGRTFTAGISASL